MNLENVKDEIIIKEAVERLIAYVSKKTYLPMKYGSFVIQVHDGSCANIEFNLKERCFTKNMQSHKSHTRGHK